MSTVAIKALVLAALVAALPAVRFSVPAGGGTRRYGTQTLRSRRRLSGSRP